MSSGHAGEMSGRTFQRRLGHTCGDKDWITCFVRWEVKALGSSRTESKYGNSYASMILHGRHYVYKERFCKYRHTWQSLDTRLECAIANK